MIPLKMQAVRFFLFFFFLPSFQLYQKIQVAERLPWFFHLQYLHVLIFRLTHLISSLQCVAPELIYCCFKLISHHTKIGFWIWKRALWILLQKTAKTLPWIWPPTAPVALACQSRLTASCMQVRGKCSWDLEKMVGHAHLRRELIVL